MGELSQADVAEALEVTQGYISKLERQDDMLVSKLYAYVEALGGEVEIRARLPNEEEVQINQFNEIEKLKAVLAPTRRRSRRSGPPEEETEMGQKHTSAAETLNE